MAQSPLNPPKQELRAFRRLSRLEQAETTMRVLIEAQRLLSDPSNWCKHAHARTVEGDSTYTTNVRAHSFDLTGAINRASHNLGLLVTQTDAHRALQDQIIGASAYGNWQLVSQFNDAPSTTHEGIKLFIAESIRSLASEIRHLSHLESQAAQQAATYNALGQLGKKA